MILTHFTKEPFTLDRSRTYEEKEEYIYKPHGLWLSHESTDNGWKSWCKSEEFALERLKFERRFKIIEGDVLILRSLKDMRDFNDKYTMYHDQVRSLTFIDWVKVKRDYKGLIITPYHWPLRLDMDFSWYYGWDCASGCIWDLSAIKESK